MSQGHRRHVVREHLKSGVRSALLRANLGLAKDPYAARLGRSLEHFAISDVFDIGANVGQFGGQLRSTGYEGRILSCEPLSAAFSSLQKRTSGDQLWTPLHTAVGAEVGTADINVSQNSYSSSLLPISSTHVQAAPRSRYVDVETVPVTTVRDLVAERGVDERTLLLKIDTQGFEGPVLDGAGDVLDTIAMVQVEMSLVELYDGQASAGELFQRLVGHGLSVWGVEAGIADEHGRVLQVDAVFARVQ